MNFRESRDGHQVQAAESSRAQFKYCHEALSAHFAGVGKDEIIASARMFPAAMRADLQGAIERLFAKNTVRLFGVHHDYRYQPLSLSRLLQEGEEAKGIGPVQVDDVDIGDLEPVRCFDNAVWLRRDGGLNYVVVVAQMENMRDGTTHVRVEIGVPAGSKGADLTAALFKEIEASVHAARCYRGRVLSLERGSRFDGTGGTIKVHRLGAVPAEHLILPVATRRLIDRNVLAFAAQREKLRALGQSTKKGILLYGPPGTGKTHTIRYLASNLAGHTTLIVTAEQVGLISEYFTLARLLQPAMLVIEDVDLIARNREQMGACEEVLLNRILNEMDGLAEDSDLFFILTTNRPEQIEPALASRPGRIDQAIELPLPDAEGRRRLIELFGAGLELSQDFVAQAVSRTQGVSGAFIKELMRRTAQGAIAHGDGKTPSLDDLRGALDEMLFAGGRLNVKLLGGAVSADAI